MFDNEIEKIKEQIITTTCDLINIPSVHEESNNPSMPFGKNINKALDYVLNLGKKLGFKTKNIDGYCGYLEFGEGEEMLGIIGHLDVVPADNTWSYSPFAAKIDNGKIYGRGAIDDKGPVAATIYAMKTVMDVYKVNKRVRLILGLNEERNWKCIEYYKQKEELPTIGFSPDADFPCIYAEKGLLNVYITDHLPMSQDICIISVDDQNNAMNVVPRYCKINLKIDTKKIYLDDFISNCKEVIRVDSNISFNIKENNIIEFTSHGISAHAAHPDLGDNAITKLVIAIKKILAKYSINIRLFDFIDSYIANTINGEKIGLDYLDESGRLTLNVSKLSLKDNILTLGMNLRIPIHTDINSIKEIISVLCNKNKLEVNFKGEKEALYIPKDNPLVNTLCNIYNEYTNQNLEPIAIGGATYARALNNCISFGANMPGNKDMCHQSDEFISINNLMLATNIYAKAIYELTK